MTIISIGDTAKRKVHNAAVVTAELLLGVALGCAMWFGIGDKLTYTVRYVVDEPAAASTPVPTPVFDHSTVPEPLAELYGKNPDARQFVRDYPEKHDLHPEIDLSVFEDATSVPRLYQWDERWGYESYNENFFALAGCGPTCLSMVDIYLTGRTEHDPLWMARFAEAGGHNEVGNGTKWSLFSEGAAELGLRATGISLNEDYVKQTLRAGTPIICIMSPGDFTEHGHYLVLTGVDADGNILLNDPNSRARSNMAWPYERLARQIRGGWAMTSEQARSAPQPDIG